MIKIPLRTGNGQNNREHFRVAAKRAKAEREAVLWALKPSVLPSMPCTVLLTRVAPSNGLDQHDNLRGALKHCVDAIADWFGIKDNDPRMTWEYAQARGPWAVQIEVTKWHSE